jgi:hypothetical protein
LAEIKDRALNAVDSLQIKPGTYRLAEVTDLFSISRRTLERYIDRLALEFSNVEHQGKPVKALTLSEATIKEIIKLMASNGHDLGAPLAGIRQDVGTAIGTPSQTEAQPPWQPAEPLASKTEELLERLMEAEIKAARMEGQMEKMQEVVEAKNAVIKALEDNVTTLKASLMLEARRPDTPMIEYAPTHAPEKDSPSLWSKLKRIVAGS